MSDFELAVLPQEWKVPPELRVRLGQSVGRQRAMSYGGHLLLVLHAPPEPDELGRRGRFFWRAPDGTWQSTAHGNDAHCVGRHLGDYVERLRRYDELEERATTAVEYFALLEALAPLQRSSRNLHNALQEARQSNPDLRDLIDWRDRAYEIDRSLELLYTDARNSLEFAIAKRAEEQAKTSQRMAMAAHRLNMMAGFFFPIATLSSIFGVNLIHGWENVPGPGPFLVMLVAGFATGALLTLYLSRE